MSRKETTLRFLLNVLEQSKGMYGYDFCLPHSLGEGTLLWNCAVEVLKSEPPPPYTPLTSSMRRTITFDEETRESKTAEEIYPLAADILWQLCLRGILRPGARGHNGQAISSGQGYSLTLKGREWLKSHSNELVQELLNAL